MFFSDCFYRILAYLGLRQKEKRTLLLVLDHDLMDALRLRLGVEDLTHPASGELSNENVKFKVFELDRIERMVLRDYHVKMGGWKDLVIADADSWLANGEEMRAASTEELDAHLNTVLSLPSDVFSFLKIEMFAESKEKPIVFLLFNFLFPGGNYGALPPDFYSCFRIRMVPYSMDGQMNGQVLPRELVSELYS